jgi:hypothetical protein
MSLPAAENDAGDAPKYQAQKARAKAPKEADIDKKVTLEALIQKSGETDWSADKAAQIEGYVLQVEQEEDGDCHLALASAANETDTRKWLIVEVTPGWRSKHKALSMGHLRGLVGKHVGVTGWLFFEPDAETKDPRGTRWELHPVTEINIL